MTLAPWLPLIHRLVSPWFQDCLWQGSPVLPEIALTFDDGPHPEYTPALLAVLRSHTIPATFFCLGERVKYFPDLVRATVAEGHWLGLHGYTHQSFPFMPLVAVQQSLQQTQQIIASTCNLDASQLRDVRPPNGLLTPRLQRHLSQWGYRTVQWTVVPVDWVCPGVAVVTQRILKQTRNGAIIVLHDGFCGGRDVAAIARQVIPALQAQGFRFVTLDRLWQQHKRSHPTQHRP
ncbi:polysaccharide deacetylase family protein [Synechococcales cyanobacterium C]|uniref:Polysaccharide deacetylase family protein n=1 Tax=Petrachloros mirabilis ULC683 TaxID=2781853 RepID=A0A8K1ZYJ4_9CYAN|nr:polysaccharide deacetylase family protein [Petrachloros mirabilis]NCJ06007.1 polysaccharide deacetylase family protein [Petrachloros mirabilis ULC683]